MLESEDIFDAVTGSVQVVNESNYETSITDIIKKIRRTHFFWCLSFYVVIHDSCNGWRKTSNTCMVLKRTMFFVRIARTRRTRKSFLLKKRTTFLGQ